MKTLTNEELKTKLYTYKELQEIYERATLRVKVTGSGTHYKYYDLNSCIKGIKREF